MEPGNWLKHQEQLQQLQQWTLKGKINIRTPNDSETPYVHWQQNESKYSIHLFGTLGFGATYIKGDGNKVVLERAGQQALSAASPEDLLWQELHMDLPLSHLFYWIKGLPMPGDYQNLQLNDQQFLKSIQQSGWQIQFFRYDNHQGYWLPHKIRLQKDQLKLLLVVKSWNTSG